MAHQGLPAKTKSYVINIAPGTSIDLNDPVAIFAERVIEHQPSGHNKQRTNDPGYRVYYDGKHMERNGLTDNKGAQPFVNVFSPGSGDANSNGYNLKSVTNLDGIISLMDGSGRLSDSIGLFLPSGDMSVNFEANTSAKPSDSVITPAIFYQPSTISVGFFRT